VTNATITRSTRRGGKSNPCLIRCIYDDRGNSDDPAMPAREGSKYRLSLITPLCTDSRACRNRCARLPAARGGGAHPNAPSASISGSAQKVDGRDLIRDHVVRVEVHADQLTARVWKAEKAPSDPPNAVRRESVDGRETTRSRPMISRRRFMASSSQWEPQNNRSWSRPRHTRRIDRRWPALA